MPSRFYRLPPSPIKGLCAAFALTMPLWLGIWYSLRFLQSL
jgi:hypothetical protein